MNSKDRAYLRDSAARPECGWRDDGSLPEHYTNDWEILRRGRVTPCASAHDVLKRLRSWQPLHAVLVAGPTATRFRPPVCFEALAPSLVKNYRRQASIGIALFATFACFLLYLFLSARTPVSGGIFAVGLMLLSAFAIDSFGSLWRPHGLMERAQFFYWIQTSPAVRAGFRFWLVFAFLIGASQLVLQAQLGGQEQLLETYGAVYAHVQSGEIWRVLVGPFFHSGLFHFFNNLLLLSFVGPLTWAVLRPMSALVLFIGYPIGMLAQMYFGGGNFDSFLGISPGVFALFGLLIGSAAFDKSLWPKGFALLSAWIAVISIFAADVVSDRAATSAHIVGFAFGVLVAFICTEYPAAENRTKTSARQRQYQEGLNGRNKDHNEMPSDEATTSLERGINRNGSTY